MMADFLYLTEFRRMSQDGLHPIGLLQSRRFQIKPTGQLMPLADECRVIVMASDADVQWQTDGENVANVRDCRILYARQEKTYLVPDGRAFAFIAKVPN